MNKKHGFTISELLMSIAIISIVSAMGMTIAKRGTDDAYKNYFAIGTMNLYNALAQIETGDVNLEPSNNNTLSVRTRFVVDTDDRGRIQVVRDDQGIPIRSKFIADPDEDMFKSTSYEHYDDPNNPNFAFLIQEDNRGVQWLNNCLVYLFGDTNPNHVRFEHAPFQSIIDIARNNNINHYIIDAANGITYEIIDMGDPYQVDGENHRVTVPTEFFIRFMMIVPAPRTRQNPTGRARTEFMYYRNANVDHNNNDIENLHNSYMLIPLDRPTNALNNRTDLQNIPFVNLQDREDLLLAYIDDGVVGRHVANNLTPIRYGTFRDALYTIIHNDNNVVGNTTYNRGNGPVLVNFNAYDENNNNVTIHHEAAIDLHVNNNSPTSGTIKFASPRKLK